MTKRINCKFKVSRRIGKPLWGSAKDPVNKRNYPSGQHGLTKGYRRKIGYAEQAESARVLCSYYANITKKQFRRIVDEAKRRKGDSNENMIGLLESRLDAVIYRAKLAPTPFSARQLISHKHFLVNGRKVNIASYSLKPGDVVQLGDKSKNLMIVAEAMASADRSVPDYISVNEEAKRLEYVRVPTFAEVPYPVEMKPSLVIEFYSH